jgi:iron complex outermembrane recepter protein
LIVDFAIGKDVGLGAALVGDGSSSLSAGLRYAEITSNVHGDMRAVPDMMLPEDAWQKYDTTFHQYIGSFDADRSFEGVGPTLSWDASMPLWRAGDSGGHLNLEWAATGGALFGKQKATIAGMAGSDYFSGPYPSKGFVVDSLPEPAQTPLDIAPRDKSATVPVLDLSLGLSFEVPGVKLSTGYRWERYFDAIDGGFTEHQSYDRTIDGPYFRVAIGLGG